MTEDTIHFFKYFKIPIIPNYLTNNIFYRGDNFIKLINIFLNNFT